MRISEFLEMQHQISDDHLVIVKRKNGEPDETLMKCKIAYWENINDSILDLYVSAFRFNSAIPNNKLIIWCDEEDR